MVVAAGLALAPAAADATRIVYVCAPNLCAADPESGASAPITTDGPAAPYRFPGVTRDGARLSAVRGNDLVLGAYGANLIERRAGSRDINGAAMAPDGAAVAESHSYVENVFGCPLTGGCLKLVDRSRTSYTIVGAPPEDDTRTYPGGGGTGFLGAGSLLSSYYTLATDNNTICVVVAPTGADAPCEPRVTVNATLGSPTGSPDGALIAAAVGAPKPSTATSVNLYDAASGALVRTLADNAGSPTFSPDGKQVAYGASDGWIYVVSTAGGTPQRLVEGGSPTWGGGEGPGAGGGGGGGGDTATGASVASKSLRYRKGRIAVKVRCAGSSTCRGTLRLKKGKSTVGSRSYRVKAKKSATVSVKPTARGKRTIAKARKHRLSVQLKPKKGKSTTSKLTLRR